MSFEGKVAIVTGAGRGIGLATAELLCQRGASVVLVSRTADQLSKAKAGIENGATSKKVLTVCADISKETDVEKVFSEAQKAFGKVDILVNNAGTILVKDFEDVSLQEWESVQAVNVRGTFLCSRAFFRQAKQRKATGSIVNISSLSGIRGTEKFKGFSAYVASKHAVVGITEALAVEGRLCGIRVNCVAPGAVDTKMLHDAAPFLKTNTKAADVARTIVFLCDEKESSVLTGAVVEVHSNV